MNQKSLVFVQNPEMEHAEIEKFVVSETSMAVTLGSRGGKVEIVLDKDEILGYAFPYGPINLLGDPIAVLSMLKMEQVTIGRMMFANDTVYSLKATPPFFDSQPVPEVTLLAEEKAAKSVRLIDRKANMTMDFEYYVISLKIEKSERDEERDVLVQYCAYDLVSDEIAVFKSFSPAVYGSTEVYEHGENSDMRYEVKEAALCGFEHLADFLVSGPKPKVLVGYNMTEIIDELAAHLPRLSVDKTKPTKLKNVAGLVDLDLILLEGDSNLRMIKSWSQLISKFLRKFVPLTPKETDEMAEMSVEALKLAKHVEMPPDLNNFVARFMLEPGQVLGVSPVPDEELQNRAREGSEDSTLAQENNAPETEVHKEAEKEAMSQKISVKPHHVLSEKKMNNKELEDDNQSEYLPSSRKRSKPLKKEIKKETVEAIDLTLSDDEGNRIPKKEIKLNLSKKKKRQCLPAITVYNQFHNAPEEPTSTNL